MATRILIVTVFVLTSMVGESQVFKHKNSIDLAVGPAYAVGPFAQKNITNSSSGFATTGKSLNLSFNHLLSGHFGLAVKLSAQQNAIDTRAMETAMTQVGIYEGVFSSTRPGEGAGQQHTFRYGNWNFNDASWKFGSLLAGGYGQLSATEAGKIVLQGKILVGLVYALSPAIDGKSTADTASAHFTQAGGSALGAGFSIGGGVRYRLTKKVYLLSEANYFGTTQLSFKNIETSFTTAHFSNGAPSWASNQASRTTGKQQISSINAALGIGLNF